MLLSLKLLLIMRMLLPHKLLPTLLLLLASRYFAPSNWDHLQLIMPRPLHNNHHNNIHNHNHNHPRSQGFSAPRPYSLAGSTIISDISTDMCLSVIGIINGYSLYGILDEERREAIRVNHR